MGKRFRVLVMVDLGGTIFFRSDKKDVTYERSFKAKQYQYWLRPGFKEFIIRLTSHPRCTFSFYTSIMKKNVVPIL